MSGGLEPRKRICQSLKKEVSEERVKEYMKCEQERSFNRSVMNANRNLGLVISFMTFCMI